MTYIKVKWNHSIESEPVLLYSELDDQRMEIRKVEVFSDGRMDYADAARGKGNARLGKVPVPPLAEIESDPEFEPIEIGRGEFDAVWTKAHD
jgi:hypothetical protein